MERVMAEYSSLIPLTSSARDALVFANTPAHLFRLLQIDPVVQYCVQMLSEEQLIEDLKTWSSSTIEVPEMLLQPYTALIALASVASPEAWAETKRALPNLPWIQELLSMAEAMRAQTTIETHMRGNFYVNTPVNQSAWGESECVSTEGAKK